jgi:cyclic pyranopterin phosphate synthase
MSALIDKYGRTLNYLRLSVTDRCNFRCYYCMPEEGIDVAPRAALLSFDEMHELSRIFALLGVSKVRITGGEPFVRKGLMPFLESLSLLHGEITITTNGTLIHEHLKALLRLGIRKVNLSLDSLSRERFFRITRRDSFEAVLACVYQMLDAGFELKLNCVVAAGKNTEDILPFVELTRSRALAVRFLEEMPFNGGDHRHMCFWNHKDILDYVKGYYPDIERLSSDPASTSVNYRIPGYAGTFGIIPSFSRTFCGSCNRLRLSASGELRTCLYGPPAANLRDLLRSGADEARIISVIRAAVSGREPDGFAAEAANAAIHHSMSVLGG